MDRRSGELAAVSEIGQCVLYRTGGPIIGRLFPGDRRTMPAIDRVAEPIADFSRGALAALRARARADGGSA